MKIATSIIAAFAFVILTACNGSVSGTVFKSSARDSTAERLAAHPVKLVRITPQSYGALSAACRTMAHEFSAGLDRSRRIEWFLRAYKDSAAREYHARKESREWKQLRRRYQIYADSDQYSYRYALATHEPDSVFASLPGRKTLTDLNGVYHFQNVTRGEYWIAIDSVQKAGVVPVRVGAYDVVAPVNERHLTGLCEWIATTRMPVN